MKCPMSMCCCWKTSALAAQSAGPERRRRGRRERGGRDGSFRHRRRHRHSRRGDAASRHAATADGADAASRLANNIHRESRKVLHRHDATRCLIRRWSHRERETARFMIAGPDHGRARRGYPAQPRRNDGARIDVGPATQHQMRQIGRARTRIIRCRARHLSNDRQPIVDVHQFLQRHFDVIQPLRIAFAVVVLLDAARAARQNRRCTARKSRRVPGHSAAPRAGSRGAVFRQQAA